MNGTSFDCLTIDRRPIITCAGELEVFSSIEDSLSQALPQDSCEWRRSLGRPVRPVHIGANFAPFSSSALPKGSQWDLIRQPLFHIYWTECTDVDNYKLSVRDDIEAWLKELQGREISDWLIVVVENYDGKRGNKLLPRTTVLDKIRADFAPKQGDRCVSVINPGKTESKSAESWKGLVNRIRHLLLVAYAKAVSRLEDYVRQQRERRNEPGWNFMRYFHLQEELAQVLEMLGLNDEALIQYDELDALFSQFVANGLTSESVHWLTDFQKPLEKWHGLKLGPCCLSKHPSLLELRAYLFAKQAQMLLLTNKVWDMASRCLPFLHTCNKELNILDVTAPVGSINCWLFLASMEVLQTCDKFNHADEVKDYSLHTACLWHYASQKLRELGELCGLMPGNKPTSEQLHLVVSLSAGMGDNPGPPTSPSPTDKLKQSLCSQEIFNKTYLELAELAMGTYKHIGRLRSARLVGREVASFYIQLNETQKAAAFLSDAIRTFEQDKWHELAAQTKIELAQCYKQSKDYHKLIKISAGISAATEIDTLIRWTYFEEMQKQLLNLKESLTVPFDNVLRIVSLELKEEVFMQDSRVSVDLVLDSSFPREILCSDVLVSIEAVPKASGDKICHTLTLNDKDMKPRDPLMQQLRIKKNLEYKQDKQLASAAVTGKLNELKRKDSSAPVNQSDFTHCLVVENLPLLLTPGINIIRLSQDAKDIGKYQFGQVSVHFDKLHFISNPLIPRLQFDVREEKPSLILNQVTSLLLSGIEQTMNLILTVGSYPLEPKSVVKLTASRGLNLQIKKEEELTSTLEFEIGQLAVFSSTRLRLRVLADMLSKDHQVTISVPWQPKPITVNLSFTPPLSTTWRLHSVKHKKYLQVNVLGQCDGLSVKNPRIILTGDSTVILQNSESSQVISNGASYSYIWEVRIKPELASIKTEFNIDFSLKGEDYKLYQNFFELSDFHTLYVLEANVEPAKGSEFCRVGAICHLHLSIKYSGHSLETGTRSLMYEVLAEPNVWAVCGRTAGVVSFDDDLEPQTVVLDVMPLASGYLPLPLVRISKYIPAESGKDIPPRLEPFSTGQVYNCSKGKQLHVITGVNEHPQ